MLWGPGLSQTRDRHWNPLMIEESTDPRMPGRAYRRTLGGSQFEEPEASLGKNTCHPRHTGTVGLLMQICLFHSRLLWCGQEGKLESPLLLRELFLCCGGLPQ
jgi:hypothetical protein